MQRTMESLDTFETFQPQVTSTPTTTEHLAAVALQPLEYFAAQDSRNGGGNSQGGNNSSSSSQQPKERPVIPRTGSSGRSI